MSSSMLLRSYAATRPLVAGARSSNIPLRRTFVATQQFAIKETSAHDPDYDKHKQDSLAKQKDGKGHWKPELASDSEESVKADRSHNEGSSAEDIKKLQERTKAAAQEKSKHGTSMRDGL